MEELLAISKELLGFADNELKPKITATEPGFKDVTLVFFAKSTKTFRAICELCSGGFGEDAAILVRTLLENVIGLSYIAKEESQHRAQLFACYSLIDRKRKADQIKNDPVLKGHLKDIDRKFNDKFGKDYDNAVKLCSDECKKIESLGRYQTKKYSWSCLSVRDMAADTGLKELYFDKVYWMISQFAHPDASAFGNYVHGDKNDLNFIDRPSMQWVKESLVSGFDCYSKMIRLVNQIFDVDLLARIDELEEKYVKVVGEN